MELVQFSTRDGLRLNGILEDAGASTTVIHIHGKGGNFYENQFIKIMLQAYPAAGFNFLSFNNRGHSSYVEAYQDGEVIYIGAAVEKFSDSLLDLEAAERFARTLGSRVVFQGHSFGCEKIMYYSQNVNPEIELVLLSPCDGYRLQEVYRAPETVEEQVARIRSRYELQGLEWLDSEEYGIEVRGKSYYVPIVAWSLIDLLEGPAFELLALGKKWTSPMITARSFAYIGGQDTLQVDGVEAMQQGLHERFENLTIEIFPNGDHHLKPSPQAVVKSIISWLRANVSP